MGMLLALAEVVSLLVTKCSGLRSRLLLCG